MKETIMNCQMVCILQQETIDAKQSNLKHNAYLYNRYGNRAKTKLKKNRLVKTYGVPIRIKNKEYYIVNVNGFIKKANL